MIVFCLASVRSGTTAIAQCFRETTSFVNLGEIFYNASDGMGDYVHLWEYPNPPSLQRFSEYLDFLRSDSKHLYWLDIKFHDLNRFNPLQLSVTAQPLLLRKIIESGDRTLLLGRANYLRAAASELEGIETGIFHKSDSEDGAITPGNHATPGDHAFDQGRTINIIRAAVARREEFRFVEAHLRSHPRLFLVDYEALFACPDAAANRAALGSWIGADIVTEPNIRKVSGDWPGWFDRDLAAKILQGTCSQWWVP